MKKISTIGYTVLAAVLSILVLSVAGRFNTIFYNGTPPDEFRSIVVILFLLIAGSPGILSIIRKEFPSTGFTGVHRGNLAVISGVIWVVLFYSPIFIMILSWIKDNLIN